MSTLVENNNSAVHFSQVWPEYVYTNIIPETPPELETGIKESGENKDGTLYTTYTFIKKTDNEDYPYLKYISHFQLTKEYRQENIWKLEFENNEEYIRRIIFPGKTSNRLYTPSFSSKGQHLPFTNVNPKFDLKDCRIFTNNNFEELYFSGWLYVGKNLTDFLDVNSLPLDDQLWLIKNNNNGYRAKFEVTQEKTYTLPPDMISDLPLSKDENRASLESLKKLQGLGDVVVTANTLNRILYHVGELDGGVYW